jgi:predicted PurR-regulated permease PerM
LALVLLGVLLWKLAGVLLLAFSAVLVAMILVLAGEALGRRLRLPRRLALALAILLAIATIAGIVALFGWRIAAQYQEIVDSVIAGANKAMAFLRGREWGRYLLQRAQGVQMSDATDALAPLLGSVVSGAGRSIA